MVLRHLQQQADSKGVEVFLHFSTPSPQALKPAPVKNLDLNRIMQNMGGEAFAYDSFKSAYDSDPQVKDLVEKFDEDGITLKTQESSPEIGASNAGGDNTVSQMAKRATDLKDL